MDVQQLDKLFPNRKAVNVVQKLIGTADAARKLSVTQRRLRMLCDEGRIARAQGGTSIREKSTVRTIAIESAS